VSLALRNRLDSVQKEFNLYGQPPSKLEVTMMDNVNVNALQFEASVIDGPTINSRAGLYVYVNAMVILLILLVVHTDISSLLDDRWSMTAYC
jgi:mediator of RNA polymerase II transcription subunit 5